MFLILFIKIHLFFCTDYYFNYFKYIDLKRRIRVSSFWNILNVFDLVGCLENSISSTGIKHFWILWKEPNICLNYNFIEYDLLTLTEMNMIFWHWLKWNWIWTIWLCFGPSQWGLYIGTETSFFWGLPPASVWFWA